MTFGFSQQSPCGLPVNFITVDETRFKCTRVTRAKPLQEIRTPETVTTFRKQNYRAAFVAGKRRHVESLVSLDQIDVVRKASATRNHDIALCRNRYRVLVQVIITSGAMRESPVAAEHFHGTFLLVNNRVDAERWRNECGYAFTFFVYCISVEKSGANACFATAAFEIEREHVRRFDCPRRCETRADRLATTCESGEVVKIDPAG